MLAGAVIKVGAVLNDIDGLYQPGDDLETTISRLALRTFGIASLVLIVAVTAAALVKDRAPKLKLPLFLVIAFTMVASTLWLAGSTVYLNLKSDSGGPVHWHADVEFWVCDNQLELRDPTGLLSNKIGTATLHEHDDQRIHLEGVVVEKKQDASLGKFMHVIGGAITDQALVVPLNDQGYFEDDLDGDGSSDARANELDQFIVKDHGATFARMVDGGTCQDQPSKVQVFALRYDESTKTYSQTKLERPQDFVIAPEPNVPPGDCVIFEFGPERDRTDKLCRQFGIRDVNRCESFGVTAGQKEICEVREASASQDSAGGTEPATDLPGTVEPGAPKPGTTKPGQDSDCTVGINVETGKQTTHCPPDDKDDKPNQTEPSTGGGSSGSVDPAEPEDAQ